MIVVQLIHRTTWAEISCTIMSGLFLLPTLAPRGHGEWRLTVSLWSVLETECEGDDGVVLEELRGEGVPPQVVALLRPLLQPLVHLVDPVVGLQGERRGIQLLIS